MAIQRLSMKDVTVLKNPGKRSEQLVWPHNAPDARATLTRVTMEPGSVSKRHAHARSEQIWIVERGSGRLLLRDGMQSELRSGDIVRTPPGETHGVENTGNEPLVYLAITTPPEDFTPAYAEKVTA
jgi:mannose-6-phosphate isomerase-like protein (cupin superfamily)